MTLLILSTVLLAVSGKTLVVRPKEAGQNVFSVFQSSFTATARWISNTVNSISELKQARRELGQLREKILEYERISRDIVKLREENSQLRELLEFSNEVTLEHVPALVIARQPGNYFSVFTINRGASHGVKRYMPVVARMGGYRGLVGKVIEVSARSSSVLPLFNEKSFVAGRLQKSRYEGLVAGQGELASLLMMRNVKKDALQEIQYGDLIVTSGLGGVFPKDIPVGRVRAVRSEAYQTSLEIAVEPIVTFSKLEYVIVLVTE